MTYPARPAPCFQPLRSPTRWLSFGLVALGLIPGCSDDANQTEPLNPDAASTTGSTTMTVTTGSATTLTTGSAASTTGATSVTTVAVSSSSASTSSSTTSGGTTTSAGTTGSTTGSDTTGSMSSTGGTSSGTDTSSGAGGSGGSGTTTTGGGPTFQPCPDTPPCKVLPLGDSITFGLGFDGGYRVELFHLALEGGHDITFTGTQQPNGPSMVDGVTFPRNHAGISGQLIAEIAGRIPNPDMQEMPHIILVHAGTNDMVRSRTGAEGRLEALMDKLIDQAPDALLVFSNLIPLSSGNVEDYNDAIPAMVEARANAGAHIIFADQYTDFPTSELGDGVHPNQAGYARMAGVWYEAIEPYLP